MMPDKTRLLMVLALIACLASPSAAMAGRRSKKKAIPKEQAGPQVHLSASMHHGFRPVTVTLTANLTGVKDTDQQFCHIGVDWESHLPFGGVTSSVQDPRCLHPPELVKIQHTFTKVVTLTQIGTYSYRLILHLKDGTVVRSNTQDIRVLNPQ